ncbi:Phytase-like domain-containing protein [Gammaproteobacteria bacterium]
MMVILRFFLAGFLLPMIIGCTLAATRGEYFSYPLLLDAERPTLKHVGKLEFRGAVEIRGARLGGLSGLWVALDGRQFVAISDLGRLVSGLLKYDTAENLVGIDQVTVQPVLDINGLPVKGRRHDSEEIARSCTGSWLISFEQEHRLANFPTLKALPEMLPIPLGLADAPANGGIEAMTVLPDCRVILFEEGDDDGQTTRRGWITPWPPVRASDWQTLSLRVPALFRPTSATASPVGLILLERQITLLGGWKARIVRVPDTELLAGAEVIGEELARLEMPLLVDNFEGIAARPGPHGETLIYLISDNNVSPLQRTILMLLALPGNDK